jgi:hypothetical protein
MTSIPLWLIATVLGGAVVLALALDSVKAAAFMQLKLS